MELTSFPHLVWKVCNCAQPSWFPSFPGFGGAARWMFAGRESALLSTDLLSQVRAGILEEKKADSPTLRYLLGVSASLSGSCSNVSMAGRRKGHKCSGAAKSVRQGGIMVRPKPLIHSLLHFSLGDGENESIDQREK